MFLFTLFKIISKRPHLRPPPVLPPQAPTNISISIIVFEKLGHRLKSSVAKPVVVIILDTVNAA